jgi:tRNA pseudouridine synthase 9
VPNSLLLAYSFLRSACALRSAIPQLYRQIKASLIPAMATVESDPLPTTAIPTLTPPESPNTKSAQLGEDNAKVGRKINPKTVYAPHADRQLGKYIISNNLRRVEPYYWTYNTFAKGRWLGRPLLDIFACEMRDRTHAYYKGAIEAGLITINGEIAGPDTIVRNGDMIRHVQHRHEPPVSPTEVGIVAENDELLVINKPAGVPVHPAGRFFFNSVMELLRAERGASFIPRPCNRLDRLTSGIMFVGKSAAGTEAFTKQLRTRTIHKEYIARVLGEFPEETIVCGQPVLQISPKLGLNAVRANGKDARTVFKRLAYYPPTSDTSRPATENSSNLPWQSKRGYSIVRCYPLTGRTHQLRVHLQFLGHPISNDPIYANQRVFGPNLWSSQVDPSLLDPDEAVMERLERMGKEEVAEAVAYYDELLEKYEEKSAERLTGKHCEECDAPLYSDPGAHELIIYLHARRYACVDGEWSYETGLPLWALPPDGMDGPTEVTPETELTDAERQKERENLKATVMPEATRGNFMGMIDKPKKDKKVKKVKVKKVKENKENMEDYRGIEEAPVQENLEVSARLDGQKNPVVI